MFPSDLTNDPLLARSDKLIRWGAFVPWLGLGAIALTGWALRPSAQTFVREMLAIGTAGQVLVWIGMNGLRRCRGWAFEGVLFYVWVGGVLGAAAVASTGVMYVAPVPLAAPVVATLARLRSRKEPAA